MVQLESSPIEIKLEGRKVGGGLEGVCVRHLLLSYKTLYSLYC